MSLLKYEIALFGKSYTGKWETIFMCPHIFKFWTRLLTGTTTGMSRDCVHGRGNLTPILLAYIRKFSYTIIHIKSVTDTYFRYYIYLPDILIFVNPFCICKDIQTSDHVLHVC